jgi:hypothetical protein
MKRASTLRRRRPASSLQGAVSKRENKDPKFFGAERHEPFFQPAVAIQRAPESKQEEEKVTRAAEEKKEEKISRAADEKKEETVQRTPGEKKEEDKVLRATKERREEKKVGARTADYIHNIRSHGRPMAEKDQTFYGERMGYDFSKVRIHTGADAAESARDAGAKAYTYGDHVVFNEGRYNTDSHEGRTLIAHELTHVVQQGKAESRSGASARVRTGAGHSVQRGILGDVWRGLTRGASAVWEGLTAVAGWSWDVLKSAGAWVWDLVTWLPSRVWSLLTHFGSGIVGIVSALWNGLVGALGHVWDGLSGLFSWIGDGVVGLFGWIWRGLRGGAQWAWRLLHGDFSAFWSGIGGAFSWLGAGVVGLLEWGWRGLEGLVIWGARGIRGLARWLWEGLLGGLAWVGRFIAKLFDIIGAGELWTLFWNIFKGFSTRVMTGVEQTEARKVFAASIAYWQVRIDEMSLIASIGSWFQGGGGMGVTTAHTINFNRSISAAAGNNDMAWLVHELGHVAQYTHVGLQYMGEAIHSQATVGYDYGGGAALAGKSLSDFNREQQADILKDYYRLVLYGTSSHAAEYTRMRNEAVSGSF